MSKKIGISGSLSFIALGDLIQLIGTNGSTGVLTIKNKYADNPGIIYFQEGKMIDAIAGGAIGVKAIYDLFGWVDGDFEFTVGAVKREPVVKENRMEIILNGLSMLDDGVTKKLGPEQYEEGASKGEQGLKLPTIKGPLVDYMYVVDEDTYPGGTAIVEQGKHGGWIWVILEGVVEIHKETKMGPVTILRLGTGAFIGSISTFLIDGAERSATVKAIGDVQLGVLDSQLLSKEYSTLTAKAKEIVLSLDRRLKLITNTVVKVVEGKIKSLRFNPENETLLNWDDYKGKACVITEGEAYIVTKTDNGEICLMALIEDDVIGEIPFFDFSEQNENISIYISHDFQTIEMNSELLINEFDRLSTTFKNVVDNMISSISITTNIALRHIKNALDSKKTVENGAEKE